MGARNSIKTRCGQAGRTNCMAAPWVLKYLNAWWQRIGLIRHGQSNCPDPGPNPVKSGFSFARHGVPWGMPSFDIVSEVNSMEIENAVNQANKELANRFDFKGSNAAIVLEKNEIKLS